MALLDTLHQKAGFTRKEALAILILGGTFLGGLSLRWFQSMQKQDATSTPAFDYRRSDSAYASLLHPEQKVLALTPGTAPKAGADSARTAIREQPTLKSQININSATKAQLMNLPGIGPSLADRILEYRTQHGAFSSVDDLRKVKGIGAKKFEKLRHQARVR
jgi:comEA protein